MIQRIQTIYLFLASLVSGGLIFVFNLWNTLKEQIFVLDLLQEELVAFKLIPLETNLKQKFVLLTYSIN